MSENPSHSPAKQSFSKSTFRNVAIAALLIFAAFWLFGYLLTGLILGLIVFATGFFFAKKSVDTEDKTKQQLASEDSFDAKLSELRKKRDQLKNMRIRDEEVGKAIKGFAHVYDDYITACLRSKSRDPDADVCAEEVLRVLDIFLNEQDGSLLEAQLGLDDTDAFKDPKERTLAYIAKKSTFVRKAKMNLYGDELGGDDQLKIEEEMLGLKTNDDDYDPLAQEIAKIADKASTSNQDKEIVREPETLLTNNNTL